MSDSAGELTVPQDECLALLQRVLASRQIARSLRLRAFLTFIVHRALLEGATNIREQEIGKAVFDRYDDYDTTVDNIVRVNATELRKRLEHYFKEEGGDEELVLEIPRGGYVPLFYRRSVTTSVLDAVPEPEVLKERDQESFVEQALVPEGPPASRTVGPKPASTIISKVAYGLAALSLVLMFLLYRQWQQFRALTEPWRANPALSRMWADIFDGSGEVDIIVADTSLAMIKDITGQPVTLDDYIHFKYGEPLANASMDAGRESALAQVVDRTTVSLGDVRVAEQIFALNPHNASMKLLSAREVTSDAMRRSNVVLIGSPQSNPWAELFRDQMNFSLEYDMTQHRAYILNKAPAPGEQPRYQAPTDPARNSGYAVVASLPGLRQGKHVLILEGTDAQATQAAGEFVTSPAMLGPVLTRLPQGKMAPFELLLRTRQLTGTPFQPEVVALRSGKH